MPKAVRVKRGGEYLHDAPLPELEAMYRRKPQGKSGDRLQAAVLRKRGETVEHIADMVGAPFRYSASVAVQDGARRVGVQARSQERGQAAAPDAGAGGSRRGVYGQAAVRERVWPRQLELQDARRTNMRQVRHHMQPEDRPEGCGPARLFDVQAAAHALQRRRARVAGGAHQQPRGRHAIWREEGRAILAVDAATLRGSPASRRGLRRRGGKGVVRASHSKKAIHLIGAPGNGTPDLQFHENLKGEGCVVLVEYARRRHRKVGILADNAVALAGRDTEECIAGTRGAVEIMHIPPHTPQLNPIEIEWREIKAAIPDIFFGGLDKMRDAIIRMLYNKEMPIVKLFDWPLPP